MVWCYELRGTKNRLVELRSGFSVESEAREAGLRAKRMIDCICYPNVERLTLIVKMAANGIADQLAASGDSFDPQQLAQYESHVNLKYSWQKLVVNAFLEPHPENLPLKINLAERALSSRLLDPAPFDLEERLALGEALLALRRLLRELFELQESAEEEDIA